MLWLWLSIICCAFLAVVIISLVFEKDPPTSGQSLAALAALDPSDKDRLVGKYKLMNSIGNGLLFIPGFLALFMGYRLEGIIMIVEASVSMVYHLVETPGWRTLDMVFGGIYTLISLSFLIQLAKVQWGNPTILIAALMGIFGFIIWAIYSKEASEYSGEKNLSFIENRLVHSLWHFFGVFAVLLVLTQMLTVPSQIPNEAVRNYITRTQKRYKTNGTATWLMRDLVRKAI